MESVGLWFRKVTMSKIAKRLGAKVVAQVPATGGGAFGAARLAHLVAALQTGRAATRRPPAGAQREQGRATRRGPGRA